MIGTAPGPTPTEQAVAADRDLVIRAAAAGEATVLFRLIADNLETGHLLPRPLDEVERHAPRFLVAATAAGVIACGELAELGGRVAEVRSLVVTPSRRGRGVGTRLLAALVKTARSTGIRSSAHSRTTRVPSCAWASPSFPTTGCRRRSRPTAAPASGSGAAGSTPSVLDLKRKRPGP